MATCYIEGYKDLHRDSKDWLMPMPAELYDSDSVAITGASAQSSAMAVEVRWVALTTDTNCQFEIGSSPTADGDSRFLHAGQTRFYKVSSGDLVAVIQQQVAP